ncbi:nuclear transport factor 2 family protein [Taibaiella koreensis]|uniref:nuclear transport factor 2 family protein n=1 Tax=Taibaiella koreensis TaxID=1268548 RepID=UPI001968D232|nr:nuclear transport factor 2 family protein [Taibaiella koreensis]
MSLRRRFLIPLLAGSLYCAVAGACSAKDDTGAQAKEQEQKTGTMDIQKVTDSTARAALDAWQKGDGPTFLSFFAPEAQLFDDGHPRDFRRFVAEACGHERFTDIDKVANEGRDIYGPFHTEQWGDFNAYFKFHINDQGKITRLDIGQASD